MITKIKVLIIVVAIVLSVVGAWLLVIVDAVTGGFVLGGACIVWLCASLICESPRFF